jgi:hypothetical protein
MEAMGGGASGQVGGVVPEGNAVQVTEESESSSDWSFWSPAGPPSSEVPREIMFQAASEIESPSNMRIGDFESTKSLLREAVSQGAAQAERVISSGPMERKGISAGMLRKGASLGGLSKGAGQALKKSVSFGDHPQLVINVRKFEKVDKEDRSKVWIPPEELVSLRKLESDFRKITNFEGGAKTTRQKDVVREAIHSLDEVEACFNVSESSRVASHAEEDYIRMPRLLLDQIDHLVGNIGASTFVPSESNKLLASVDEAKELLGQVQDKLKAAFPRKSVDRVFKISVGQADHYLKQVESCLAGLKDDEFLSLSGSTSHEVRIQASLLIGKIEEEKVDFKPSDEVPSLDVAKSQLESIRSVLSKSYYRKAASVDDAALLKMRSARLDEVFSLDSASSDHSDLTPGQRYVVADAVNNLKKVEPCFLEVKDRKTSSDAMKNASLQDDPWGLLEHVDSLVDKFEKGEVEFTAKRWARSPEVAKGLLESIQKNLREVRNSKGEL